MIDQPLPFKEAIEFILDKEPFPAGEWDAAEWAKQEEDIKFRAFFSAKVENARFLDRAQGFLFDHLANTVEEVEGPDGIKRKALKAGGRANFVRQMREFMVKEGMATEEEFSQVNNNSLQDIRSEARLRLIFDTNIRQAHGYGQWKQGQHPAILRRYPAQRFVRDRSVVIKRERHRKHENDVKLKSDVSWWANYQNDPKIGGFNVPYPPFGFHSGMGVEDVSAEEAVRLGLKLSVEKPDTSRFFNTDLQVSVKKMNPATKKKLIDQLRAKPQFEDKMVSQ